MTCYQHPSMPAHDRCANCGKEICAVCITHFNDKIVCRDCAEVLRSQPAPVAAEPQPEAQAPPAAPAPSEAPAPSATEVPRETPAPPVTEPSGVPAPLPSTAMAPVARPSPPATVTPVPDPGAGGRRSKEPLLSAALSLILPGAGQAYNGEMGKGLVLAAIYLGTIAIIAGGMVVSVLSTARNGGSNPVCCFCLPLFIVPMIVLVYAIYDAYNAAEKINSNQPVREWP